MSKTSNQSYIIMFLIAIIAAGGIYFMMEEQQTPGEKMGEAVQEFGEGIEDAAQ